MPRISAGLLIHRLGLAGLEALLVHPGGPFWKNKDEAAWTIPKGEPREGEDLLETAKREVEEETGLILPGPFTPLAPIKQKGGKTVHAWSVQHDCDPAALECRTWVSTEWPPKSGKRVKFPEVDQARFFDLATARRKINPAQAAFLDELARSVGS